MALTIPQALKRIDRIMNQVQEGFTVEGQQTAKSKTPVDTGKLQGAWNSRNAKFHIQTGWPSIASATPF